MLFHDFGELLLVARVGLVIGEGLARELHNAPERLGAGIVVIVHDYDVVALVQKTEIGVRTDVARAAGDQNAHMAASSEMILSMSFHFFSISLTSLNCVRQRSRLCFSR